VRLKSYNNQLTSVKLYVDKRSWLNKCLSRFNRMVVISKIINLIRSMPFKRIEGLCRTFIKDIWSRCELEKSFNTKIKIFNELQLNWFDLTGFELLTLKDKQILLNYDIK